MVVCWFVVVCGDGGIRDEAYVTITKLMSDSSSQLQLTM